MAESSSTRGSEHTETSQHDMMALLDMANSGSPTVQQVGIDLRTQQWVRYLDEQLARNRASNKIAYLASSVKSAMADHTNKERKQISSKVTEFFVKKMCRVSEKSDAGGNAEATYTDQEFSIPMIFGQMTAEGTEIPTVNEWISSNTTAQRWVSGVINGLATAGAYPPSTKDTRKNKRA